MLPKRILYISTVVLLLNMLSGQDVQAQEGAVISPELKEMYQEANAAMSARDYDKAINIYFQAIRLQPNNIVLRRDLAYAYYLSGRYNDGIKVLEEIVRSGQADEASYQLLSALENANGNKRGAARLIDEGLKKYPHSGALLYSKGNMALGSGKKNEQALRYYVEGIRAEPQYANNYLTAAKILLENEKPVWAIIYAEIFVNLEPESNKSIEGKKMLLDAYKQLFAAQSAGALPTYNKVNKNKKLSFEDAVKLIYSNNYLTVAHEMNLENITMLRVRFLLDWMANYSLNDHSLFRFYDGLIKNGQFEAYNQFLLGAITDSGTFSAWVQRNGTALKAMSEYIKRSPYRPSNTDPQYK